jgi:peptide/nickel transport system ATP-binding protein
MSNGIAIQVDALRIKIDSSEILKGVSFDIADNKSLAIVGQSGSGKTMTVRSLMGLLPKGAKTSGNYKLNDEITAFDGKEKQWRKIRGSKIGMIMQDPFTALDPLEKCGKQILAGVSKELSASFNIKKAMQEVGLPIDITERYPSELSGGQRQRIVIAAALATSPLLLIADEATTALDVITQKEILDLIDDIRVRRSMPLIMITHNIRLAKSRCDRIIVMENGVIAEQGSTGEISVNPKSTAAKTLLRVDRFLQTSDFAKSTGSDEILLTAEKICKCFGKTKAVINADIKIYQGECVGVVGQSGSGKTTLARCLAGLTKPDFGKTEYFGKSPAQVVFQDPYSSLNPAHKIRFILEEALRAAKRPVNEMEELLSFSELPSELLERKPASLSGGQRQRVAIARALALKPDLLICDESVSALDVVVQNHILKTIDRLRCEKGLSVLFITHDLSVLKMIANRVYVMNNGRIVENADTNGLFSNPKDSYTKELIKASIFGTAGKIH